MGLGLVTARHLCKQLCGDIRWGGAWCDRQCCVERVLYICCV
jgi:hypothetical protein